MSSTVTYKYDDNGALATVTDSDSGITTTYYYDFTDRLMKFVESSSAGSHSVGYAKATGGDLLTEESGKYLGWQFGLSGYSFNMHSLYTNTETLFCIPTINLPQILIEWLFEGE